MEPKAGPRNDDLVILPPVSSAAGMLSCQEQALGLGLSNSQRPWDFWPKICTGTHTHFALNFRRRKIYLEYDETLVCSVLKRCTVVTE